MQEVCVSLLAGESVSQLLADHQLIADPSVDRRPTVWQLPPATKREGGGLKGSVSHLQQRSFWVNRIGEQYQDFGLGNPAGVLH